MTHIRKLTLCLCFCMMTCDRVENEAHSPLDDEARKRLLIQKWFTEQTNAILDLGKLRLQVCMNTRSRM